MGGFYPAKGPSEDMQNCRGLVSPAAKAAELPQERPEEAVKAAPPRRIAERR